MPHVSYVVYTVSYYKLKRSSGGDLLFHLSYSILSYMKTCESFLDFSHGSMTQDPLDVFLFTDPHEAPPSRKILATLLTVAFMTATKAIRFSVTEFLQLATNKI